MRIRRLIAAALCSLAIAGSIPAAASAQGGTSGELDLCSDVTQVNEFSYFLSKVPKQNDPPIHGVYGNLLYHGGENMRLCDFFLPPAKNNSASSSWIAIVNRGGGGGEIIQAGIFRGQGVCNLGVPCDGTVHAFWTWGRMCGPIACGGPNGFGPEAIDLGPIENVNSNGIEFAIVHNCGSVDCTTPALDRWDVYMSDNPADPIDVNTDTPVGGVADFEVVWASGFIGNRAIEIACETNDRSNECGSHGTATVPTGPAHEWFDTKQLYFPDGPFAINWEKPKPAYAGFKTESVYNNGINVDQTDTDVWFWTTNR